jgi:tetratricopeptide (TPR) repeat protein
VSLEKLMKTEGEDHPATLKMMNNTAATLRELNRHEESFALFQKVLKRSSIVLGEDDPDTIMTMNNVASELSKLDRYDEAIDLQKKVLKKLSRIQGDEHPDTVKALSNLAMTQYNAGRNDDARQSASWCLPLARQIGDEDIAARCVDLLSRLDIRKKYNEVTSDEQRRLLAKINDRRNQAIKETEAVRLKAAVAQSSTKEPSIDDLMAQWGFDDNDGGGKKKSSNATSDGGGSNQKQKRGNGKK